MLFVVLHELSHIAYRHTSVWKHLYEEDKVLANCACDFVINLQLFDIDPTGSEIEFPKDAEGNRIGLYDTQYRGMDAQQIFKLLQAKYGTGQGASDELGDGQFDEHDFEGAEEMTAQEKQELASRVMQALHQGKQLAGKLDGKMPRELMDLVQPQVKWEDMLRDLVKVICRGSGDSSWRKYSKRHLGADIFLPQNINQKVGRILVANDTSGSIGGALLNKFLTEVVSIAREVNPEGLDMLYWDTEVAGHEFYTEGEYENIFSQTKPSGGGGTNPECIVKYMEEHKMSPQVVVVLTDGYFGKSEMDVFGNLSMPTIWCVVGNDSFEPTFGKAVYIKE
jgi:predicted metal-dependent peptidase